MSLGLRMRNATRNRFPVLKMCSIDSFVTCVETTLVTLALTPLLKTSAPLLKASAPLLKTFAPLLKTFAPLLKTTALLLKSFAPLLKSFAPLLKSFAPLLKVFAPFKTFAALLKTSAPLLKTFTALLRNSVTGTAAPRGAKTHRTARRPTSASDALLIACPAICRTSLTRATLSYSCIWSVRELVTFGLLRLGFFLARSMSSNSNYSFMASNNYSS